MNQYNPKKVSSPWKSACELLECHPSFTKGMIRLDKPLTEEDALFLQDKTGVPASFWLEREANYRKSLCATKD